jgi:lysophospholipase L1-like esterase
MAAARPHARLPRAAALAVSVALGGLLAACGGGPGQPPELRSGWPGSSSSAGASPPAASSAGASSAGASSAGAPSAGAGAGELIVFDGDSLTEGYFLAPTQSYPAQVMRRLPGRLEWRTFGISGQTWPDLLRDVRHEVDPLFRPSRRLNLVVVWAGANDLAAGYTAQQVYENARRYCEARRQVGFTVITATQYPLEPKDVDRQFEARRSGYNDLLRAHWREFADALVDVAADERIGDASDPARRRYFIDAVHLNEAGYGVIADCFLTTLRPLVEDAAQ